jgi:hypothetical protein
MTLRSRRLFSCLIVAQAAHSLEEYLFRLYDVWAPARWVSGLFSGDLRVGFASANILLVLLGLWCYVARVRVSHPSGRTWAWFWALLETANGLGHLALAVGARSYFPGAFTAPVLLVFSLSLATSLGRTAAPERV